MHAEARSTIAPMSARTNRESSAFPQFQLLAPPKRSRVEHIFAEEIVVCMIEARHPAPHEVDVVAARIWNDIQAGGVKKCWCDVVSGSRRHRRMIAAARAALGERTDALEWECR